MLQRIQTLFLLLALLTSAVIFFLPLAHFSVVGFSFDLYISGVRNLKADAPLDFEVNMILHITVLIALIVLSGLTIFLYKNRPLQMKLCRFGMMLNIVFIVLIFMFSDTVKKGFLSTLSLYDGDVAVQFGPGSIMPLIALIFLFLANKFIKKDEMLVRAADRLR